jgi:D-arabinose 1-dehydrogenase-like Zn-dependent alcohol dehydrogenase
MSTTIPQTMKALVCPSVGEPLTLTTVPVPSILPGSCLVKILVAAVDGHLPHILSGQIGFTFPKNFVPGARSIGRVAALGPDTTTLKLGQLVMLDPFIRARDDPNVQILWGMYDGPTEASKRFMADNWAMAGYAEYCRAPLENAHVLDEAVLCGELGYSHADLLQLGMQLVAFGGLRSIGVQAGETVVVAPATGAFSGSAVHVAVAMGATVIAMSRNRKALEELQAIYGSRRVRIVENTGDVETDTAALKGFGEVDAYIDISPYQANNSTHIQSCFKAVKPYGRVVLMGVVTNDIPVPYSYAMWNNLTIRGQYMYERADARALIKLAESGNLKLGEAGGMKVLGQFGLDEIDKAFELAAANTVIGNMVVVVP